MSTSKEYLNFVLEQLSELEEISHRAMMGEYIIYYRGKIAGGIYDSRLLIKPTEAAKSVMPEVIYEIPYKGAKEMLLVDNLDDKNFLKELFEAMYDELPEKKVKKKRQPKIEIKPFCMEYAAELSKALNNKKILDNLRDGLPYPYTVKDAEDYISFILDSDKNSVYVFAVCVDNKVIGTVGAFRGSNIHFRTAELGYYIAESYWGKGIMTEAVALICDYIFENTDIIRIYAEPFSYNIGSCRILEKNDFICEGVLRKNAIKNGKVIDMKLYSKVKG